MHSGTGEGGRKPPNSSPEGYQFDANVGGDIFYRKSTIAPSRQRKRRRSPDILASAFARKCAQNAAHEAIGSGRENVDDPAASSLHKPVYPPSARSSKRSSRLCYYVGVRYLVRSIPLTRANR